MRWKSRREGAWALAAGPILYLLIGTIAVSLFLWTDYINKLENADDSWSDILMDLQIHATEGHLVIEEFLDGDISEGATVYEHLDQAIKLANVLLYGGVNEQGLPIDGLRDPALWDSAAEVRSGLLLFKAEAAERMAPDARGFAGEDFEKHDTSYKAVLEKARFLESTIELDGAARKVQFRRLFTGMLIFWVSIVAVTSALLLQVEKKRREAKSGLLEANEKLLQQAKELQEHREELTSLVEERTEELSLSNKRLQEEVSERTRTAEMLSASEKDIRRLTSQLLDAQEGERRRISMELHDALGQALNVIKLNIRSLWKGMQEDQVHLKEESLRTMEYIDEIIETVRRISLDLSPAVIEDFGLTTALKLICRSVPPEESLQVTCHTEDIDKAVSDRQKIVVYRIIQEAISNASRHAGARTITVEARREGGRIIFSVKDDGRGFDPALVEADKKMSGRLGLTTMRERASLIEGDFRLTSRAGEGTTVTISIPAGDGG